MADGSFVMAFNGRLMPIQVESMKIILRGRIAGTIICMNSRRKNRLSKAEALRSIIDDLVELRGLFESSTAFEDHLSQDEHGHNLLAIHKAAEAVRCHGWEDPTAVILGIRAG